MNGRRIGSDAASAALGDVAKVDCILVARR
jgi:hypothetical protein